MTGRLLLILALMALPAAPARAIDSSVAFETELSRLSEILGALHHLRNLCGANEGAKWRNEMQAILDAEGQIPERRAKLIASFNKGYRGFQQTYRSCTPAADTAIRRYLDEGAKIAREITARYTN
ncbi:MAG: TIGR02301 family protein [Pseudorhodoplanes sp.]